MKKYLKKYCCGCNLCSIYKKAVTDENSKGFLYPENGDDKWLKSICPASGLRSQEYSDASVWGRAAGVYAGWSADDEIRKKSSSGGILSEAAIFLLEKGMVDGIIQTAADRDIAYKNTGRISYTKEEVLSCCGSRYSVSHPLEMIKYTDKNKKYAIIGKPCDITAFRNLAALRPELSVQFPYMLSFFCMGVPSDDAQKKLLEYLECDSETCSEIKYRGNGWPGNTEVTLTDGSKKSTDYDTSWGKILGRDLMTFCRYCLDGVGESADISCGDLWYIKNKKPDFSEHDGRNVIFARTETGNALLHSMRDEKKIHLQSFHDYETVLPIVQKSQFERRTSMLSRILALIVMCRPFPKYSYRIMRYYAKHIPVGKRIHFFLGMVKRIAERKI